MAPVSPPHRFNSVFREAVPGVADILDLPTQTRLVRAYVATAQTRPVPTISTELLFDDVHRQLVAFAELVPADQVEP